MIMDFQWVDWCLRACKKYENFVIRLTFHLQLERVTGAPNIPTKFFSIDIKIEILPEGNGRHNF